MTRSGGQQHLREMLDQAVVEEGAVYWELVEIIWRGVQASGLDGCEAGSKSKMARSLVRGRYSTVINITHIPFYLWVL